MMSEPCDHCKWCKSLGCNEHEAVTGPARAAAPPVEPNDPDAGHDYGYCRTIRQRARRLGHDMPECDCLDGAAAPSVEPDLMLHTQEADANGVWCREDGQRWACDIARAAAPPVEPDKTAYPSAAWSAYVNRDKSKDVIVAGPPSPDREAGLLRQLVALVRIGFLVKYGDRRVEPDDVKGERYRPLLMTILEAEDTESAAALLDSERLDGLDVERLAMALHASYLRDPAMPRIYWNELRPDEHAMWRKHAKAAAAEYARLNGGSA